MLQQIQELKNQTLQTYEQVCHLNASEQLRPLYGMDINTGYIDNVLAEAKKLYDMAVEVKESINLAGITLK